MSDLKEKTLGILSSWAENCGNASYTGQLIQELSQHFKKAECIPLNQALIHSGNSVEEEVLQKVKQYDFINIQYEAALYGKNSKQAHKFMRKIIDSHNNITITLHSIDVDKNFALKSSLTDRKIVLLRFLQKLNIIKSNLTSAEYSTIRFFYFLNKLVKQGKNIQIIVHRKGVIKLIEKFGLKATHHPIVSTTNNDIQKFNNPTIRNEFLEKYNLDTSKTYIGLFGFLGAYKGFDVALKSLKHLPENYHLIMCCQRHPMKNILSPKKKPGKSKATTETQFQTDEEISKLNNIILENDLINRVHYVNHLIDEDEFKLAIAGTDIPIFPYYEVAQGGSGTISYALNLNYNAKIIASRTKAFEDYYNDYYPNCFTFFDQGNEIELAYKIQNITSKSEEIKEAQKKFSTDNNIKTYITAANNSVS